MADTLPKYRFLPWTRRGLAAVIQDDETNSNLRPRAKLPVVLTLTNVDPAGIDLQLYGPGDVIGVDPRMIVRTEPRPNITDFEPNYFAAIEFDFPDFPWMFTPARAKADNHLRPWCVLVVLDKEKISPPKVNRGAPLPVVTIPQDVSESELPDLGESWAWAHVQVMSENTNAKLLQDEMTSQPNLNVSRLMCPRRLQPNHHYIACLVPAFDLGVQRGFGFTPTGTILQPAWKSPDPGNVTLPVYFHWEFATGPTGDFESLARKLTPIKASGEMGFQRMFVGDAGGVLPVIPKNSEAAYLRMEGVLRAPKNKNSSLDNVVGAMQAGLRKAINAPAQMLSGANKTRIALSPPIYGEWHLNSHEVDAPPDPPFWLHELNLDPRARAAAGLGGEVIRANQEDFMQVAWEQVGDVIDANELLNRARFSLDVHRRTYKRHYVPLPEDRLLQMTGALHPRTVIADKTVRAQITVTSLPDASIDPAMRRFASPQRSLLKAVARRANFASGSSRSARSRLIPSFNANKLQTDPAQFMPDSITGAAFLDKLKPPTGATRVDLSSLGIEAQLDVNNLNQMQATRRKLVEIPIQNIPRMKIRQDLPSSGVILKSQLDKLRDLHIQILETKAADTQRAPVRFNVPAILSEVSKQSVESPDAVAILVNVQADTSVFAHPILLNADGALLMDGAPVANLEPELRKLDRAHLIQVLTDLPVGALPGKRITTGKLPTIEAGGVKRELNTALPPTHPLSDTVSPPPPTTILLPLPVRDPVIVARFKQAFDQMSETVKLDTADPLAKFVEFNVKTARDTLISRLNPDVIVMRRVKTMIGGEAGASLESLPGIRIMPTFDRIMVAPELDAPMYTYLAKYDRERFLPGIGQLPSDSITLLETNPRFIEAFMVGLNYEMNRELLWREYPTDQRGTTIRKFWDWSRGVVDLVDPIHEWSKGELGSHVYGGAKGSQIVLLVRGQLLRRYPNTMIYAWKAEGTELKKQPGDRDVREPVFRGAFDPDVSFAGFDLHDDELNEGDGWFFVLQEHLTESRFGFDETSSDPLDQGWSNASWSDTGVAPGNYLTLATSLLKDRVIGVGQFGKNSAHMAFITLQKPMRVAIHAKQMVEA